MRLTNPKGAVLITLIVAMTLMAALGVGIYSLTTTSTFGEFLANQNDNAYDLARAGIRYGVSLRTFTLSPTTFQMPDGDHTFTVEISGGVITATGVVNPGTFLEARRRLVYDASWAPAPNPGTISFTGGDMPGFGSPIVSNPSAIQVNLDGQSVNLGGGATDSYGSLWYQGSSSVGFCNNGECSFGIGIRAYFDFTLHNEDHTANSTDSADGFTFTVMSALTNSRDRTSGASPAVSQGELMGYAGPDNTTDTLGLRPPKLALEFDTYPNNGSDDICASGSRNDPDPFSNHAALMFWGAGTISGTCSGTYARDSFDDNRHGAGGSGSDPLNSATASDADYYQGPRQTCKSTADSCNWMEDGYSYSARLEILRPITANGGGTYDYQINGWVLRTSALVQPAHFQDVTVPYADAAPQIVRTVSLSQADHDNFSKIYFGFTEATGARSQQITLSNFKAAFPQGTGECSYAISPADAAFTSAGGTGNIAVTPAASCPWWVASVNPASASWLHITSGGDGTSGSGTVSYTVDANAGAARTGYIAIGGKTFTVTQAMSCTYALSAYSRNFSSAADNSNTLSVTATSGCDWTAASNDGWITINSGASGTGNGTVNYGVAANAGPARTGTMTIAGLTFTVSQASGCTYSIAPAAAAVGVGGVTGNTVAVTAGASCPWTAVSNNGWITLTGGASGTGNGTVTYNVAANTGATRTGTMTIAGQSFTVTQSGCHYVVTTNACYNSGDRRIYVNADVTGGTPASVTWTLDGANQGALDYIGGTLWGGNRNGCGLTDADRSGTVTRGTHTVTVTATGSCTTGSDSVQVVRP